MTKKIGIAWFLNETDDSCFTCLNGVVEEVTNINALDPQVFWLTNISTHLRHQSDSPLKKYPFLKHAQFFRVKVSQVCIELNVNYDADLHEKLRTLEVIYKTVANTLEEKYKVDWSEEANSAIHAVYKKFVSPQEPILTLDGKKNNYSLNYAIQNSRQLFQGSGERRNKGTTKQIVALRIPRSAHSLAMLQWVYPTSSHYRSDDSLYGMEAGIANGSMANDSQEVKSYLEKLAQNHAGFVEFEHISIDDKHAAPFKLGHEKTIREPRTWACIPEILFILNYTKIKIKRMFLTEGGRLPVHPHLPDIKSIQFNSYAAGIVNELIWCALSYRKDEQSDPVSCYYRAYDRIMTGDKARSLILSDFTVTGFSLGIVRVMIDKDASAEQSALKHHALNNHMIPQFNIL